MFIKTHIITTKKFEKQLDRVPNFIRIKVLLWVHLVETRGISEVSKSKGYHDEPLLGKRLGQRSVRINNSYRLIYSFKDEKTYILLLEVNKHDY